MNVLLYYLLIINMIAFILYGFDKSRAKRDAWRIPEATLICSAAIGGAYGALLGMRFFHHKTRKPKFRILVPLCVILWTALIGYAIYSH